MTRRYITVLAAVLLASLMAVAAGTGTCIVKGTVTDAQGKPVAGATIEFTGIGTGAHYSTKSDKKGYFIQVGIVAGRYRVDVSKDGQKLWTIDTYDVSFGTKYEQLVEEEHDASYENKLNISIGKVGEGGGVPVPLTPAQQQVRDELQKQATAAPTKDEKVVSEINRKIQQAQAARKRGDWDAAAAALSDVTGMDPMNAGAYAALGEAYFQQRKWEQAATAYTRAVVLKPSDPVFHQALAATYSKMGQVDDATAEFDSAALADPGGAGRYYLNEGIVLNDNGRDAEALAAFDKAIAADPKLADAYYFKGTNLMKQAQLVNGKLAPPAGTAEAFRQYLALQPAGPHADEAKAQLAKIGG